MTTALSEPTTREEIDALLQKYADQHGLDPDLVKAVIKVESGFDPTAQSGAGAQGLMQLMPGTASALNVTDPLDPEQNIAGGTKYLADMMSQFGGDPAKALAAYNAGPTAVKKHGGIPPYSETKQYVKDVLAETARLNNRPRQGVTAMTLPKGADLKRKDFLALVEDSPDVANIEEQDGRYVLTGIDGTKRFFRFARQKTPVLTPETREQLADLVPQTDTETFIRPRYNEPEQRPPAPVTPKLPSRTKRPSEVPAEWRATDKEPAPTDLLSRERVERYADWLAVNRDRAKENKQPIPLAKFDPIAATQHTQTVTDVLSDPDTWKSMAPIMGSMDSVINDLLPAVAATRRVRAGDYSQQDVYTLSAFQAKMQQDQTFAGNVAQLAAAIPGFAIEISLTSPAFEMAKTGLEKGAQKAVGKLAQKAVGRAAIKAGATIAAGTAQSLLHPHMIMAETLRRFVPQRSFDPQDIADIEKAVKERDIGLGQALAEGTLANAIEFVTERGGDVIDYFGGRKGVEEAVKQGLLLDLLKKHDCQEALKIVRSNNAWHGPIGEWLEQEASKAARSATGLEPYQVSTPEEVLAQLLAFSVPTVVGGGIKKAFPSAAEQRIRVAEAYQTAKTVMDTNPDGAAELMAEGVAKKGAPSRKTFERLTGMKGTSAKFRTETAQLLNALDAVNRMGEQAQQEVPYAKGVPEDQAVEPEPGIVPAPGEDLSREDLQQTPPVAPDLAQAEPAAQEQVAQAEPAQRARLQPYVVSIEDRRPMPSGVIGTNVTTVPIYASSEEDARAQIVRSGIPGIVASVKPMAETIGPAPVVGDEAEHPYAYQAATPGWAEQPSGTGQTNAPSQNVVELPEILDLARGTQQGLFPRLLKTLGSAVGRFVPGKGITLRRDISIGPVISEIATKAKPDQAALDHYRNLFAQTQNLQPDQVHVTTDYDKKRKRYTVTGYRIDPRYAARVLGHEVGHAVDAQPDNKINRGNILGRIGVLKGYMGKFLPEKPGAPGELTSQDISRLENEAKAQLTTPEQTIEEIVEEIITKEIPISPDDIKKIFIWGEGQMGVAQNQALTDYIKQMPDRERVAVAKEAMRGLIRDDLFQRFKHVIEEKTGKFLKKRTVIPAHVPTKVEVMKRLRDLILQESNKRRLWQESQIRDELKTLSRWWKPFDPTQNKAFTAYRHSSPELYADALSALLNNPGEFVRRAPKFTQAFSNYLERKPGVKALYDQIQTDIQRGQIPERRLSAYMQMMQHGEEKRQTMLKRQAAIEKEKNSVRAMLDTIFSELVETRQFIPDTGPEDTNNPRYWTGDVMYLSSVFSTMMRDLKQAVFNPMKNGGTVTIRGATYPLKRLLGPYLGLQRAADERKLLWNPLGIQGENAADLVNYLRSILTPDQLSMLDGAANQFRKWHEYYAISFLRNSDYLSDDLMQQIENTPGYVTFNFQAHMDSKYGDNTSARIYKQYGGLGEIEDPVTATVLKDMALVRAAVMNTSKGKLAGHFFATGEATPAKTVWREGRQEFEEPAEREKALMVYLDKGVPKGIYLDKDVVEWYQGDPARAGLAMNAIGVMAYIPKAVWTQYSTGFGIWNPIRDYFRTLKNIQGGPGITKPFEVAYHTIVAARDAFLDAFLGQSTDLVQRMYRSGVLIPELGRKAWEHLNYDSHLDRMQARFAAHPDMEVALWKKIARIPLLPAVAVSRFSKFGERLGKIGAARYLKAHGFSFEDEIRVRQWLRAEVASPDFLAGGKERRITNNLFMFSNPQTQGIITDFNVASRNPGRYMLKTAVYNIMPALLRLAAEYGLLRYFLHWAQGDDDEEPEPLPIETRMAAISEYMKANYNVIPIGETPDEKTVLIPIPQDHVGQFFGNLTWNFGRQIMSGIKPSEITQVLQSQNAFESSSLNPFVRLLWDLSAYAQGKMPIDTYRNQPALDERVFKAGGSRAVREIAKWEWSQNFGQLYRFKNTTQQAAANEAVSAIERAGGTPVAGDVIRRLVRVSDKGTVDLFNRQLGLAAQKRSEVFVRMKEVISPHAVKESAVGSHKYLKEAWSQAQKEKAVPIDYHFSDFVRTYDTVVVNAKGTRGEKLLRRLTPEERRALGLTKPLPGLGGRDPMEAYMADMLFSLATKRPKDAAAQEEWSANQTRIKTFLREQGVDAGTAKRLMREDAKTRKTKPTLESLVGQMKAAIAKL